MGNGRSSQAVKDIDAERRNDSDRTSTCINGEKGLELLEDYFIGEVDESAFGDHLERCPYCRRKVAGFLDLVLKVRRRRKDDA